MASLASGLFLVLLHLGVIPWRPPARCRALFCDPFHWQVLCYGIAFALVGALVLVPPHRQRIGRLVALATLLSFLAALAGTVAAM